MSDNGQEKQVLFEIKQLCKSFGPTKVLDHIDATIRQGEVVVIVGPSGSGKSTFLRSLNLLEMPTSGEILFEGKEITDPKSNLNQYRQKIGMVFQHFNLFANKTILENMTLAPIKVLKVQGGSGKRSDGAAGTCRPCRKSKRLSGTAVRRSETANRHRSLSVHASGCYAV